MATGSTSIPSRHHQRCPLLQHDGGQQRTFQTKTTKANRAISPEPAVSKSMGWRSCFMVHTNIPSPQKDKTLPKGEGLQMPVTGLEPVTSRV